MKNALRTLTLALAAGLLASSSLFAAFAGTGTTNLAVTVVQEAAIQIDTIGNTNLTSVGTLFTDYAGTTNFTYKIRTSTAGTGGSITLQITSDFSPANGPSVAIPPSGGDALTYTCAVTAPGTACGSAQTAATGSATSVATFATNAHSLKAGTSGNSVSWTLTNDPVYQTGSYTATATFTISTT